MKLKKILCVIFAGMLLFVLSTSSGICQTNDEDLIDEPILKMDKLKRPIVDVDQDNNIETNAITLRSVGAGALSLIIWPGIGQAVNNNNADKVITHAVFGLFPPYRIWSCYDALVTREGGYWNGRI